VKSLLLLLALFLPMKVNEAEFEIPAPPVRKVTLDNLSPYQLTWFWVYRYTNAFGISDQAPVMLEILYRESCFQPLAERGNYEAGKGSIGVAQFEKRTFLWVTEQMYRDGIISSTNRDPRNIQHAVAAMSYMWWKGMHSHWDSKERKVRF